MTRNRALNRQNLLLNVTHPFKGSALILNLGVDISEKIKSHEWERLPWRWVVERTFSWLNNSKRLSKDYEITTDSAETIVKISHLHTLFKRL